ncbi:TIGR03086 family metal-binding protein [Actinoplanes derwentensis]|uniref:TIGR03086 family protein n=1 Tax=Actinoplanes derwentensis TaxID=113562 RepID=A0A1H1TR64_9ACTN|nr:TIGR03086 family metal-binding protein [Actinoplanes derwentensis]GID85111.1 TIGR03086 family protein [Actinoplanes derwentensis]SDS62763.1 TIGR03086 family protein [Actinoplanes derwentensis]
MLTIIEDLRAADAVAVRASVAVVEKIAAGDLVRVTPCAGWDLGDLLAHMTAQHRGFAAAARGQGADPAFWAEEHAGERHVEQHAGEQRAKERRVEQHAGEQGVEQRAEVRASEDAVRRYVKAAEDVIAAFAEVGVLERTFCLPDAGGDHPGRLAIGMHLVDYTVHGWDVARAIGVDFQPGADVLARTLPIVRALPGGKARLAPGAAFGPAREVPVGADALTEILLLLGRIPSAE